MPYGAVLRVVSVLGPVSGPTDLLVPIPCCLRQFRIVSSAFVKLGAIMAIGLPSNLLIRLSTIPSRGPLGPKPFPSILCVLVSVRAHIGVRLPSVVYRVRLSVRSRVRCIRSRSRLVSSGWIPPLVPKLT